MLVGSSDVAVVTIGTVAAALCAAAGLGCANAFLAPFLFVEGLQAHVFKKTAVIGSGVVLLDLAVVPNWGVTGAAIVTALAEGVGLVWAMRRLGNLRRRSPRSVACDRATVTSS